MFLKLYLYKKPKTKSMKNYFNTNKEKGQTLLDSEKKASNQESKILSVFERNPNERYTPYAIQAFCFTNPLHHEGFDTPITSVRRALTNLVTKGLLVKTETMKLGAYGKMVHTWMLNTKN